MIIADKLKTSNRAEYLLYMWQVEDIIRAFDCNAERINKEYISSFKLDNAQRKQVETWYENLCNMMLNEGKREEGHLQICQNILQNLSDLNAQLLKSSKFPYYREMYYKVLPYIVELRNKSNEAKEEPELQVCFELLYGVMLLRLQKKVISEETTKAAADISTFLGQLSDYYLKNQKEPIDFD